MDGLEHVASRTAEATSTDCAMDPLTLLKNVFRQRLVFENPNCFKSVTTVFPQIYVSSGAHFHDVLFNTP
uniref:Uncharacterized protein n=1 Tax=Caenorhabditis japonica TaxID=281687 RepID=A0A8R1E8B3_CAEJA